MLTAEGSTVDLSEASASGRFDYETSTVVFLHASVAVFTPCPEGGSYCMHAVCNHNHPDTAEGKLALHKCHDSLVWCIQSGKRVPKWATLHNG